MSDPSVQEVSIPVMLLSEMLYHSKYLSKLIKYEDKYKDLDPHNGQTVLLNLPSLLSANEYKELFQLIVHSPLGGRQAQNAKLAHLFVSGDCRCYVSACMYLGMEKILRGIVDCSIVLLTLQSAPIIVSIIEECGREHAASQHTLTALCTWLGCTGYNDKILSKIEKQGPEGGLSITKLKKYIYSSLRNKKYQLNLRRETCSNCGIEVCYYFKESVDKQSVQLKMAFHRPCCAVPVHKDCYWKVVVSQAHCTVCSSDLVASNDGIHMLVAKDQGATLTSLLKRQQSRAKYGFDRDVVLPHPQEDDVWV